MILLTAAEVGAMTLFHKMLIPIEAKRIPPPIRRIPLPRSFIFSPIDLNVADF